MKKALLVGINDYPTSPLKGCINDATKLEALLSKHEDNTPNFDTKLVTSDKQKITKPFFKKVHRLLGRWV